MLYFWYVVVLMNFHIEGHSKNYLIKLVVNERRKNHLCMICDQKISLLKKIDF